MDEFLKRPEEERRKKAHDLMIKDDKRIPIIIDKVQKSTLPALKKTK